ncbi:MAG: hypothetical protein JWO30_4306 [Fibrobacteres bacterium]|nr:hypothetical protein [Fibrobacterota bacterium]
MRALLKYVMSERALPGLFIRRARRGAALIAMAASLGWSQASGTWVEGTVVDPDGKPLAGVLAGLSKAKLSAVSGSDGAFRIGPDAALLFPVPTGPTLRSEPLGPVPGLDLRGRTVPRLRFAWSFPTRAARAEARKIALAKAAAAVDTLTLNAAGFASKSVILDAYGKSLGRIELAREAASDDTVLYRSGSLEVRQNGTQVSLRGSAYTVWIDLAKGVYHVQAGGRRVINQAFSDVLLEDGRRLQGPAYATHLSGRAFLEPLADGFGKGLKVSVEHRTAALPTLKERFFLYEEKPYFMVQVEVSAAQALGTNSISPLTIAPGPGAGLDLGAGASARVLSMPWDNDKYLRHAVSGGGDARESYGAAAVFDNLSRQGLVLGAVDHDVWKTGLRLQGISGSKVAQVRVYGGAAGVDTRDFEPHGMVRGTAVASPRILVGSFPDWRAGLEEYGRACAIVAPPLVWDKGVPFGWNSWAAVGTALSMDNVMAASDFLKTELMDKQVGFGGGPAASAGEVYVNMDSYWDNLDETGLKEAVRRIHANKQKAGIYWAPFTYWGDTPWHETQPVEGTGGQYLYGATYLRNSKGVPVPAPAGGVAMDPTHPATLARIDWELQRFIDWGFDFVKLDFVTYGAIEGVHFDKNVTTGIGAYNVGMKRIRDRLDPNRIGRPFFIHLSIAPLFPHQYAHARRISCDVYGSISATEYLLNALTGAWWQHRTLYAFNDPDATVLSKPFNEPASTERVARTRLNATVISGTMMLMADDLRDAAAQDRYRLLLKNAEVNALASRGKSFRPAENDTGTRAADVFVLEDKDKGDVHAAIFNYDTTAAVKTLSPARLGLSGARGYQLYDLWTKSRIPLVPGMTIRLEGAESRLYRIEPQGP